MARRVRSACGSQNIQEGRLSKDLYAVMRYPSADAFEAAQLAMSDYATAADMAARKAASDPDGVCLIVRVVAVVPGRWAPIQMDTKGPVQ